MRTYQVISVDGHVEGPVDWSKWVPSKYKDAVPKLVTRADGSQGWAIDWAGVKTENVIGSNLYCGLRYDEYNRKSARTYFNPDGTLRPGCGDATQRLREQDFDGIDAEVIFPGMGVGFGAAALKGKDNDAYMALVRAYNDFLADYCSVAPDRLIGNFILPTTSVDDALVEMERCRKMGLRSVCLQQWPNGGEEPSPEEDDRFWAAALEMDTKISPHETFGSRLFPPIELSVRPEEVTGGQRNNGTGRCARNIGQLILHGVFDKFPEIRVHFAESQAGWLAAYLDNVDDFYQRWYTYYDIRLKKQPSEYVRDHVRFSFIYERTPMKLRKYIGVDLLMWGSDFPHSVGSFPDSRETLADMFEDVPEAEKRQVLVGNPCQFYGLDPEKALTPTP